MGCEGGSEAAGSSRSTTGRPVGLWWARSALPSSPSGPFSLQTFMPIWWRCRLAFWRLVWRWTWALSGGTARRWFERAPTVALLGLTLGALAVINTWDVPAYALVALSAGGLALVARTGPVGRADLLVWLGCSALTAAAAYVLFFPFHANYALPFEGLRWSQWRTPFWQYAAIHGAMLIGLATWLVVESWRRLAPSVSGTSGVGRRAAYPAARLQVRWFIPVVAVPFGIVMGLAGLETLGVLVVLMGLAAVIVVWWLAHRTDPVAPVLLLVLVAAVVALGIGAGVDVVVLRNDIDRMNTVFKLYLNAWVLMAIAGTVGCWHLWATRAGGGKVLVPRVWLSVMATALLASAIFPVWGTRARLADRFPSPVGRSLTLEGDAYQHWASYDDPGPPGSAGASYRLADDADALDQLRPCCTGLSGGTGGRDHPIPVDTKSSYVYGVTRRGWVGMASDAAATGIS